VGLHSGVQDQQLLLARSDLWQDVCMKREESRISYLSASDSPRMERSSIREHVELLLTSAPEQPGQFDCQESDAHGRVVDSPNGQLAKVVEIHSSVS
ncbi:hypothetical protein Tco_0158403, partial [Tanacetum coccineum]